MNANELLKMLRQGGRIESTGKLTEAQIVIARAERRMWVDEDGFGFVYFPSEAMRATPAGETPAPARDVIVFVALLAIVELDSIKCGPLAPCEGPVARAISALLPLVPDDSKEDFNAAARLAELRARLTPTAPAEASVEGVVSLVRDDDSPACRIEHNGGALYTPKWPGATVGQRVRVTVSPIPTSEPSNE